MAAVREGLAHMRMPDEEEEEEGDGGDGEEEKRKGATARRRPFSSSSSSAAVAAAAAAATAAGAAPSPSPPPPPPSQAPFPPAASFPCDGRTVLTRLARPLPAWALEHLLGAHGAVVAVAVSRRDGRDGAARFADAGSAEGAARALEGSKVLGAQVRAWVPRTVAVEEEMQQQQPTQQQQQQQQQAHHRGPDPASSDTGRAGAAAAAGEEEEEEEEERDLNQVEANKRPRIAQPAGKE